MEDFLHIQTGKMFPSSSCRCCLCDLGRETYSLSLRSPPSPAGLLVPASQCSWRSQ